ncbi:MAG TPA: type VI secretion system-associated FHA domain protein TagH [Burkholderiaceae bacterium]|nr:type VI secretion system-associated FHA domain protein TagH [Burkholderiaceae bacterium]
MPITLTVQTHRAAPPAEPLSASFDRLGGTIGRSPGNGLVLDDPGKYISRNHAKIEFQDGGYCLADIGSNPSLVNGRPVGNGRQVALNDGDTMVIGPYLLAVAITPEDGMSMGQAGGAGQAAQALGQPPVLDALAASSLLDCAVSPGADPLNVDWLAPQDAVTRQVTRSRPVSRTAAVGESPAGSGHVAPVQQLYPQPSPVMAPPAAPFAIPDDYDPLADLLRPAPPAAASQAAPAPAPPPELTTSPGNWAADPAPPDPVAAVPTAPSFTAAAPVQAAAEAAPSAPAFASGEMPPPAGAASLPPAEDASGMAEQRLAPAVAPPAAGAQQGASEAALLEALLRGLGMTGMKVERPAAEFVELVGAMLRAATSGTMGVLLARTLTKRESRMAVTMIASQANNPLKFFPDPTSALFQMLGKPAKGYMAPVAAFDGAFDDMKAHEMALLAGMRGALEGMQAQFDPAEIERTMALPSVMDKMLQASRKAKLWDRHVESYRQLVQDADEEYQRRFSEQFARAYEEQIARMRNNRT